MALINNIDIINKLHLKFGQNVELAIDSKPRLLEEFEIKMRAVHYLGQILEKHPGHSVTQKEIVSIFSEIFADLSIAMYLACCAMDNPTKILLRRVLELGISTVYFWDLPYKFWSWRENDDYASDLSFKDMLEYLNNSGYRGYVASETGVGIDEFLDKQAVNNLYRELSNVIHGKLDNFESVLPGRFSHSNEDLEKSIRIGIRVENILLSVWRTRFFKYFSQMEKELAAITIYTYEY